MNGAPLADRELDHLIQEFLDGVADEPSSKMLLTRIESDPQARARFVEMRAVFDQLQEMRALPLPRRAQSAFDAVAAATTPPASDAHTPYRAPAPRRLTAPSARRVLFLVAALACVTLVFFIPSRDLLRSDQQGAEGTIGVAPVEVITTTSTWNATDARISMGAVQRSNAVRVRAQIEARIPGTVRLSYDAARWHTPSVETVGSGGGWTEPELGTLSVSVATLVDVYLTLYPSSESALPETVALRVHVGEQETTLRLPIQDRPESTNFVVPDR